MKSLIQVLILLFLSFSLAGCLVTRSQVREQEQNTELQTKVAESQARYDDVDEDLRALRGRLEVLENQRSMRAQEDEQLAQLHNRKEQASQEKIRLLQEAIVGLEKQIENQNKKIQDLEKAQKAKATKQKAAKPSAKKGIFERAEGHYANKEYNKAILEFQKYREKYPKGRRYRQATYMIGLSFKQLGMKSEAKSFFSEVVDKFPKTKTASQAKSQLKKIK